MGGRRKRRRRVVRWCGELYSSYVYVYLSFFLSFFLSLIAAQIAKQIATPHSDSTFLHPLHRPPPLYVPNPPSSLPPRFLPQNLDLAPPSPRHSGHLCQKLRTSLHLPNTRVPITSMRLCGAPLGAVVASNGLAGEAQSGGMTSERVFLLAG